MKKKTYNFTSHWKIAAPLTTTWSAIVNPNLWEAWWPGVSHVRVIKSSPDVLGNEVSAVWESASGYNLNLNLAVLRHDPNKTIIFTTSGDLSGTGRWLAKQEGDTTLVTIFWDVTTNKTWMNVLAPLISGFLSANHKKLMAKGCEGLNRYLTNKA